jgi:hypothetical protein
MKIDVFPVLNVENKTTPDAIATIVAHHRELQKIVLQAHKEIESLKSRLSDMEQTVLVLQNRR